MPKVSRFTECLLRKSSRECCDTLLGQYPDHITHFEAESNNASSNVIKEKIEKVKHHSVTNNASELECNDKYDESIMLKIEEEDEEEINYRTEDDSLLSDFKSEELHDNNASIKDESPLHEFGCQRSQSSDLINEGRSAAEAGIDRDERDSLNDTDSRYTDMSGTEDSSAENVTEEKQTSTGRAFSLNTKQDESLETRSKHTCDRCGKGFVGQGGLMRHVKTHNKTCEICGKTFSHRSTLKKHMRFHAGDKQYSCTVCNKAFDRKDSLTGHMYSHTNEMPYSCPHCEKKFAWKQSFKVHLHLHTGIKEFSCDICQKSFNRKETLINHRRTHTGEKPFTCGTCGKKFNDKTQLNRHFRTHSGEKPYPCVYANCNKTYRTRGALKVHLCSHTGERPYACSLCGRTFTNSSGCKKHTDYCRAKIEQVANSSE